MERSKIVELILEKIDSENTSIKQSDEELKGAIGYFYIDDLLPE